MKMTSLSSGPKVTLITCLFLFAASSIVQAQTIPASADSLVWKVSGFHSIAKNEDVSSYSEFRRHESTITWVQNGGDQTDDFSITSTEGEWANTSLDGSILFHVTWNSLEGTIGIERTSGQIIVTPVINKNGANLIPFTFSVSEVVKN